MDINASINAHVKKVMLVENQEQDGQQVQVDVEVTLTPEEAEKQFGEAFHHVAFACMRDRVEPHDDGDVTVTQFGYESKKPPKWLKASVHNFNLWGVEDRGQPVVQKIVAGENMEQVQVNLRFVVDGLNDAERIGALGAKVGHTAKVVLKPVQVAAFPARAPGVVIKKRAAEGEESVA